jgi:hypothetical protein
VRRWLPRTVVHSSNGRFDVTMVEPRSYFKQKLRAGLGKRHIAEFVNDKQFDGGELGLNV